MSLTADEVKKVAKLSNLPLSEKEIAEYLPQLSQIIDYIDQLNKVDTSTIEATFNVSGLSNVFREDVVGSSLSQDETLQNTPDKKDGFFVTRGVFEGE